VRRTAGRLGRLARDAGFLGVVGATSFASAGADAAPGPEVFKLTIRVTAVADFDHTSAPVESAGCATTTQAQGFMTVRFGTRRPVLIRFVAGRAQPVVVRPLDGTAVLRGTNDLAASCASGTTHSPQACRQTIRTFRDAQTTFSSPRPGAVALSAVRVTLRPIDCPREPDELRRAVIGRLPSPLSISTATLTAARTKRITLTASAKHTFTYNPPEAGFLQQRAKWTLTFERQ
jgi:hypothetical protein